MAIETKSAPQAANGKKTRRILTEQEKAANEAIAHQRAMIGMVQNAEKACRIIRSTINKGEKPPKEVLVACSTLSAALSGMLGV